MSKSCLLRTVLKTWGEEKWIWNGSYCGKQLILKKGRRCSLHYHMRKDEVFCIISGRVLMEVGPERMVMTPDEVVHILPNVRHRFTGLEDSLIIEVSSHHEDIDVDREEPSCSVDLVELEKEIANGLSNSLGGEIQATISRGAGFDLRASDGA